MEYARELYDAGVKLIDLAADFRIQDIPVWEKWYGMKHSCPELVAEAVYGMPEMNREQIKTTTLALLPLVEQKAINPQGIVVDAKSGTTGAGRGASVATLFTEVNDSFKAYGVAGHRHHPEITQNLSVASGDDIGMTFVPHLLPIQRGILSTIYVDKPEGESPETRSVRSSNICRIGFCQPAVGDKTVIMSVIDNLTKGAAGQAVQNMNVMFGFDETMALNQPPLMP